jgi:hypothetical protein
VWIQSGIQLQALEAYLDIDFGVNWSVCSLRLALSDAGQVDCACQDQLGIPMLGSSSCQFHMSSKWRWIFKVWSNARSVAYYSLSCLICVLWVIVALKRWRKANNCFRWNMGCGVLRDCSAGVPRFACRTSCKACR